MVLCTAVAGLLISGYILYGTVLNTGILLLSLPFGSYVIFIIFTYICIFYTLLKSRENSSTNSSGETNRSLLSIVFKKVKEQGYTIPFVITLTYVLFVIIPGTMLVVCKERCYVLERVWNVTICLNTIADTLIYIFCDRDIRNYTKRKFITNERSGRVKKMYNVRAPTLETKV